MELTWASRVSSGAGVPGTSSAPTLGRSQETSGVGPPTEPSTLEWQEIGRVRGRRTSPQETALQPLTPSLCPLREDQCRPKHPRGRRVTATRRLHLTGHTMAGEGAMGRGQAGTHRPHIQPAPWSPSRTQPATSVPLSVAGAPGATAGYRGQVGGHSHDIRSAAAAAQTGQQTPRKEPIDCRRPDPGSPDCPPLPFLARATGGWHLAKHSPHLPPLVKIDVSILQGKGGGVKGPTLRQRAHPLSPHTRITGLCDSSDPLLLPLSSITPSARYRTLYVDHHR